MVAHVDGLDQLIQTKGPTSHTMNEGVRLNQILLNFSALIKGFAWAISSLPNVLKSNPQPCISGYLWDPQNVDPHLHLNPVSPTRFLHVKHRFGWTEKETKLVVTELDVTIGLMNSMTGSDVESDGEVGDAMTEEDDERVFSMVDVSP